MDRSLIEPQPAAENDIGAILHSGFSGKRFWETI
jgi:hypothetical protein